METSIIYGYGFSAFCSEENLCKFILNHKSTILKSKYTGERELALVARCENGEFEGIKEDFFDIACDITGHEGIYSIISNIMSEETGINFQYEPGQDGEDEVILFAESMPWQMNEKERSLTEDNLKNIIMKYVEELKSLPGYDFTYGNNLVGYRRVEYFG